MEVTDRVHTFRQFEDYFRCPEGYASFQWQAAPSGKSGFFRFGPEAVCYGSVSSGLPRLSAHQALHDAQQFVRVDSASVYLSFSPAEVIDNLRLEKYPSIDGKDDGRSAAHSPWRDAYYSLRDVIPIALRKRLQRAYFRGWDRIPFPRWPVDYTVGSLLDRLVWWCLQARGEDRMPFIWFWPDAAPFCILMTHDVETQAGLDFCDALMDIDDSYGVKSAFQIIPEERYAAKASWMEAVRKRGFEINVHDLNHDGRLFDSRATFLERAAKINRYVREFGARGFRSGALYRNLDWYDAFEFSYDLSVPNAGQLEAQRGGCCTVMPYFIGKILEMPLTTTQDYSLFNVLRDYSIDHWQKQIELIASRSGLASFIVHPDYVLQDRARKTYVALLEHLSRLRAKLGPWLTVPGEVDRWWRERSQSRLVREGSEWRIEGPAKDRARLAYAERDGERVTFRVVPSTHSGGGVRA